jgi:hypothetical protein
MSIERITGGAGQAYCRACGMQLVWVWIGDGQRERGMVHEDLSDEAVAERAKRGCSWHPELAEDAAAIWAEASAEQDRDMAPPIGPTGNQAGPEEIPCIHLYTLGPKSGGVINACK